MELKKGVIVISKAGHDKGDFQVVIDFDENYAWVCDGKYRPVERPKKKKWIHTKVTNMVIKEELLTTNKSVRKAINDFIGI